MNRFDTAYSRCILSLNDSYHTGDFSRMEADKDVWQRMLAFEKELDKNWNGDYAVFRAVLIEYFRFMKCILEM